MSPEYIFTTNFTQSLQKNKKNEFSIYFHITSYEVHLIIIIVNIKMD